ncbi:MAG: DUF4446 family protein [Micromonosporaceae bacterium]
MISVALSALGLLAGAVGVTLAIAAHQRADRIVAASAELVRSEFASQFPKAGAVDPRAIRDVAMVRYDALKEMAGQLSFSIALLNSTGDGIVLTSINGRTETRTYAKAVAAGHGVQPLSPEEEQSVRAARLGQGLPTVPAQPGPGDNMLINAANGDTSPRS